MYVGEKDSEAEFSPPVKTRRVLEVSDSEDETEQGEPDMLSAYRERYVDEDGPPVRNDLGKLFNQMWQKPRNTELLKEISQTR